MHNNAYDEVQRKGYIEKLDTLTVQLMKKDEDLALSKQQLESLRECINVIQSEPKVCYIILCLHLIFSEKLQFLYSNV